MAPAILLLDLVLLVLQVVSGGERHDGDTEQQAARGQGRKSARTGSAGEGANHRICLDVVGGRGNSTVTQGGHTLRYFRVITSVGIRVSPRPISAMQADGLALSPQSIQATMFEVGLSVW